MRKIILLSFMTLDGVMQAPGGPQEDTSGDFPYGGWTVPFFDAFAGQIMTEQMRGPFSLLLGRKTYEIFAGYWPTHPGDWPGINEATKYVVSTTLSSADWSNTVIVRGDVINEIAKIKSETGPDLQVHGSGTLVQTLFKHDLIDELWLKIFPLTLGTGKKLFMEGTIPTTYQLTSSAVSPSGVLFANYLRVGTVQTGSF